jgi:hypothetical protein
LSQSLSDRPANTGSAVKISRRSIHVSRLA